MLEGKRVLRSLRKVTVVRLLGCAKRLICICRTRRARRERAKMLKKSKGFLRAYDTIRTCSRGLKCFDIWSHQSYLRARGQQLRIAGRYDFLPYVRTIFALIGPRRSPIVEGVHQQRSGGHDHPVQSRRARPFTTV